MLNIPRLLKGFGYAFAGIARTFITEQNFRVHVIAAVFALTLAVALHIPTTHIALIILAIALVLSLETLNTAIEALSDKVSKTYSNTIRIVKDAAAGAVLIASLGALTLGIILLAPPLFAWVRALFHA